MENNTFSSKSINLLILLLLLCTFLCQTESALPSHQELVITGRRMMSYYKPNTDIGTPSSTSDRGGGGNGRRLMSQMDVGASSSGQGGGRNRH
ncbi:hypothetical protein ISN44_As05g042030 [Arabidopsis suecica]|jgi:hypothetical protein|uniref:Serine rich endogenous peptide 11 n=3 Tax=Arabidopsis TaxID=3701 RepID=SOP11_ARATH|nr:uncharacterized protein AT5G44582 [Arabidopsis thaliana]A8MRU6.1 RecName: Full=Serine rich endogenous peptide 11; Short=AtSCOOP11; AltName: Full=Phytocytokine SCOOP11; AltName: Full=Precursor of serine rich endogenous peptide phytocytokine 11; Flags: Precursor [Arabidopsis thaliana]AED95134.1 hypothetical protein AT5G44582 [Arabidopsis thaliana]KAG7612153.1 hypothetical protein ISN44_As05g042030 [Arabidopsis suecica]|eukprot:NP_001078714.1 hypothetical protein AT5G44582 [Arabidopsis thaliana]